MIQFTAVEPVVFTSEEACQYLRLDLGREKQAHADKALTRLVEMQLITPVMYRKERMYLRAELDRFLRERFERNGGDREAL